MKGSTLWNGLHFDSTGAMRSSDAISPHLERTGRDKITATDTAADPGVPLREKARTVSTMTVNAQRYRRLVDGGRQITGACEYVLRRRGRPPKIS